METCRQRPRLNEELKRKNERPEAFRKEEFKKEAESLTTTDHLNGP